MEAPQPPPDEETRNIIDRLANFVARNGKNFEKMTKEKQMDNPKFQFLFGGEYYGYYTYKVTTEQAILKHQSMRMQQQQQPQLSMNSNQMQPQQGMMGNPGFGISQGGAPRSSRFGPALQHFERQQGPGSPMPPIGQRFERPPFQNHNFNQMNFERPMGGHSGGGNYSNFDRGQQQHGHPQNFGGIGLQGQNPHMQMQQQFERGQPGNFERYPVPGGHRFERPLRPEFHSPPLGHQMIQQGHGMQPGFDGVSSNSMPFDRPMGGGEFERPIVPGPERNSTVFVNPNFEAQKNLQLSQPQQLPLIPLVNIEALAIQRKGLEEQILQSEKNLAGQQQSLLSQQQVQVEEALRKVQDAEIVDLAAELNVDITEFAVLLQAVMESCTKDSIANGKGWIFTHTQTRRHYDLITLYLLRRVTDPGSTFLQRLYIIYLVNDTLHHCVRKGAEDMQLALEKMVIPMFCFAKFTEGENEENVAKLNKLLALWESKPNYISHQAVDKLKNFTQAWSEYKNELVAKHALVVTQIATSIQKTFEGYQSQHLLFVHHVNQSIKQLDQKIEEAMIQQQKQKLQEDEMRLQQEKIRIQQEQLRQQEEIRMKQEELRQQQEQLMRDSQLNPQLQTMSLPPGQLPQGFQGHIPGGYSPIIGRHNDPSNVAGVPDLSRPPPGFNNSQTPVLEIPRLPYYELPAGLMVPLVLPDDDSYKPIDPSLIRLPPPCPPSERLILAIEAFYGPPSHDNPRDSEGWERLGLYEYYKTKNLARKQKEDDIREGRRQKSRSPSPIRRESSPSGRSPPRRRYQSKSPSPSTRRRRSRSRSPRRVRKRRSRSRSRSPARRSPTPPSFGNTAGLGMERVLDESNKGHQLLKKMGWGGTGLGLNEQGIEAPIKGGEIRDRVDQYKGVGVNLQDPFESYRKTKGQAFVERMRARSDDRPS